MSQTYNYEPNKKIFNNENFELSDTESDTELNAELEKKLINSIQSDLHLNQIPEPYKTYGEFIMSSIVGTSISYLMSIKQGKKDSYHKYLDNYFDYCSNVSTDEYINSILELCSIDKSDKEKIIKLMANTKEQTKLIVDTMFKTNVDKYMKYVTQSDADLDLHELNLVLMTDVADMIKSDNIKIIFDKM